MAIFFAERDDQPGGLQKIQLDKGTLELNKDEIEQLKKEEPSFTTKEEQLGGSKPDSSKIEPASSKIEVQGGDGISKEIEKEKPKTEKGFSNFLSNVGDAFSNVLEGAEKKLETVYDDKEKRAMFLMGLNTVIEASGYKPISQAASPLGMFAKGQKKGFLESEAIGQKRKKSDVELIKAQAALEKAQKGEPPRIRGTIDEAILKDYTPYINNYKDARDKFNALDARYLETFKLIAEGKQIPTGTLEQLLFPIEKVLAGTELGNKLNKFFKDGKLDRDLISKDNVTFKEILNAASKQAIVSQVKDLYPASDKDIQVLLQGLGDIATTPEALIKLISAQKAASEAYKIEANIAKDLAFEQKDVNFAINARDESMKQIANQYNDKVPDELLVELYGSADRSSPFRVAQAYFYSTLKPQVVPEAKTNFEIFQETTESEQENIDKMLEEEQKKFMESIEN